MVKPPENPFRPEHFRRVDESDDVNFYREPRLVLHIAETASEALKDYYALNLPKEGRILDLMSSYASHLPADHTYRQVTGLGMNLPELKANVQLTDHVTQDLNKNPELPFEDASFDAAMINVSIQYLTNPSEVLRHVARVLAPGGTLHITFSNRIFPEKAVAVWRSLDGDGHAKLISLYFQLSGAFEKPEFVDASLVKGSMDPIYVVRGKRWEATGDFS